MTEILAEICARKREAVARRRNALPIDRLEAMLPDEPPRGFLSAIRSTLAEGTFALIAEIKRASPSRGLIRADFDPATLARAYAEGGAICLSILTDEPYFRGSDDHLREARSAVALPCLRKDFTLDPYQVLEARVIGADCVLLIMAALGDEEVRGLYELAKSLGLDVLLEVHDADELERALRLDACLIGINNRNLKSLRVDLATTEQLAGRVPPDRVLVAESGLDSLADLERMAAVGARCFLIGESLMRQKDVRGATRALLGLDEAA